MNTSLKYKTSIKNKKYICVKLYIIYIGDFFKVGKVNPITNEPLT